MAALTGLCLLLQAALSSPPEPCGDSFTSCEACRGSGCLWQDGSCRPDTTDPVVGDRDTRHSGDGNQPIGLSSAATWVCPLDYARAVVAAQDGGGPLDECVTMASLLLATPFTTIGASRDTGLWAKLKVPPPLPYRPDPAPQHPSTPAPRHLRVPLPPHHLHITGMSGGRHPSNSSLSVHSPRDRDRGRHDTAAPPQHPAPLHSRSH